MGNRKGRPFLTYEERKQIETHVKEGKTIRTIAGLLTRSFDTIQAEIARNGGPFSYDSTEAQKRVNQRRQNLNKNRCNFYSPEEIEGLEKCISLGYTKNKTSTETGVSYFRVVQYLNKHYPGYEASTDQIKIERISLEGRINSLEMQMQIVIEQIKEIRKCLK